MTQNKTNTQKISADTDFMTFSTSSKCFDSHYPAIILHKVYIYLVQLHNLELRFL